MNYLKDPDVYLNHKKYIRIVISSENETDIKSIFNFITSNLNIKESPSETITPGPNDKNQTIEWMFNNMVSRKWINIEPLIKKRLRTLWRKKAIIAFYMTWL